MTTVEGELPQLAQNNVLPALEIPAASSDEVLAESEAEITPPTSDSTAAAQCLRERLASHGLELTDEVQLAEVPGHVLSALLEAIPAQPGSRSSAADYRAELAERIARATRLPRGARERLSGMLENVRFDDSGRDEPALRVSDAIALLEETLPAHVLLAPQDVEPSTHPRGDSYFTGDARQLSDDDARRIAAAQLARTGFTREPSRTAERRQR